MFFEPDRIGAIREMICSDTVEEREAALNKLEPMQQGDFEKLYEAMDGYNVTIRFLDPPLHEFVPTEEKDIEELAKTKGKTVEEIKAIISLMAPILSGSKNMCSVLQSPIPSAPNSLALAASVGVSALVLTFNFLYLSAQAIILQKSPETLASTVGIAPS